jgi:hypothetical protein
MKNCVHKNLSTLQLEQMNYQMTTNQYKLQINYKLMVDEKWWSPSMMILTLVMLANDDVSNNNWSQNIL